MNFFRTFGVAIVLCISLLLSGVACVLIAMSIKQQPPIGDAEVVVAGVGNSGNTIATGPSTRRLARRAIERDVAPPVDDAMLQATVRALIDRAKQGDVEAAAFVFELNAQQRERAAAGITTAR
jgi:hypothetical protein